jgi:pimeloyl-ACP methyl ester carboxylesterase
MHKELALVRGAGFHAVGIDAPMHGRRHHDDRDHRWAHEREAVLEELVDGTANETSDILDALDEQGLGGPFIGVGISLGGFSLWRAMAKEPRLTHGCVLLGSPALPGRALPTPEAYTGRKVLCIQAEHDEAVDGGPTYRFIDRLRARGEDVSLTVLEGSKHAVPEAQWWGAWGRILRWLGHRV